MTVHNIALAASTFKTFSHSEIMRKNVRNIDYISAIIQDNFVTRYILTAGSL